MAAVTPTSTNNVDKAIADGKQAQLDAVAAQEARDKIPPTPSQDEMDRIALGETVELADPGEVEEKPATRETKAADEDTEETSSTSRRSSYRNRAASAE